jgi:hypothetical protein
VKPITENKKEKFSLRKIKVTPLAAESFGVRSMCTLVETPDVKTLLDAGISLCPYRFNLPPHPIEFRKINELREKIAIAAEKAEVVTISHYHFDHHTPSFEDWLVNWTKEDETANQIYQDKIVLMKNPREKINASQRQRARLFQKTGGKRAKKLEAADGQKFVYGNTSLRFSEPVAHGSENSGLGWVIMASIDYEDEHFLFAPDIQGPTSNNTLNIIREAKPTVIMLGGPPFYLEGSRVNSAQLELALRNLENIVEIVPLVILEHHALRDKSWEQKRDKVQQTASKFGNCAITAAEYFGCENILLESKRKQLYDDSPPSKEFKQWMKTLNNKEIQKPPI